MLLPSPIFVADLQEFDLLPEKLAITDPSVFEKIALLLLVRVSELVFGRLMISCHSTDNILPPNHFTLMSGSEEFLLVDQSTSSRFALNIQSFPCPLCAQLNSFLVSKNGWWILGVRTGML